MVQKIKPISSLLVKPAGPDCNLNCEYCFYLEKESLFSTTKIHRMSHSVLEELIRQAIQQSGSNFSMAWQGGEPTLMGIDFYQRAVDLELKYGYGKSIGNSLQTNGLLLNTDWAIFLKKYSWLVGLSIDGPDHIHNRYRLDRGGQKTHQQVENTAKMLLEYGIETNAMCCITDYSARFPEELYHYYKALGLNWMQFIPIVERDKQDTTRASSFSVSAEAYGHFLIRLFDLWLADFRNGQPSTSIRHFESVFYRYVGLDSPECTLMKECGTYLVVEHNGDCYSCDFFVEPRWKLGNIMESRITNMLNSKKQLTFGAAKAQLPRECKMCSWYRLCYGGCIKDRIKDPADKMQPRFCSAYKMFFAHADQALKELAKQWRQNQQVIQKPLSKSNIYDATPDFLKTLK
jgi:uncharacterized protein